MGNELFFVSKVTHLGPGTVHPGSWVKTYDSYKAARIGGGDPWMLVLEQAIENERLNHHPTLPSRFSCTFSCLNVEVAMSLNAPAMFGNQPLVIWACELANSRSRSHIGTFSIFDCLRNPVSYADVKQIAVDYWKAKHPPQTQEFISDSPLRLTRPLFEHVPNQGWRHFQR